MPSFRHIRSKRAILVFVLIFFASIATARNVTAQAASVVTINSDGSISGTNLIQRDGNHYTLTSSLSSVPIVVECNSIFLDGGSFTLQGASEWGTPAAINLTCTNVTVENFNIATWEVGILGAYDNNTIANCSVTHCERGVTIYANNYVLASDTIAFNGYVGVRILNGNGNFFVGNLIRDNSFGFLTDNSSFNVAVANTIQSNMDAFSVDNSSFFVYHNNFVDQNRDFVGGWYTHILTSGSVSMFQWDNGYPSGGNYYNDYATRYPNATEIDTSGIEDTPYVVNEIPDVSNTSAVADRYPLASPVNISEAEQLPLAPFPSMSPPTLPTANPTESISSPPPLAPTASPTSTYDASPSPATTYSSQNPSPTITTTPTAGEAQTSSRGLSQRQVWFAAGAFIIVVAIVVAAFTIKKRSNQTVLERKTNSRHYQLQS